MAFTVDNMQHFSQRVRNLMERLQAAREEAAKLVAIYTNESVSGTDPDFADTEIATEQEHVDAITFCGDLEDFLTNQSVSAVDRTQWMTPFLQNES